MWEEKKFNLVDWKIATTVSFARGFGIRKLDYF